MNIGEIVSLNYNTLNGKKKKIEYENEWKFPIYMRREKKWKLKLANLIFIQYSISIYINLYHLLLCMACKMKKTILNPFHLFPVSLSLSVSAESLL